MSACCSTTLAAASETVGATSARGGKIAALADALRLASPEEAAIAVAFLSGELRQRQIGVGWAAVRELPPPAATPSLTLVEVDAAFARIGALSGAGLAGRPARRAAASCSRAPPSASSASCARCCRASCARARSRA